MDKHRILIAGGDMRQLYCAERLSRDFEIGLLGFDSENLADHTGLAAADISAHKYYDCALLPVLPFSDDGNIYTPCSSEKLTAELVSSLIADNSTVFAGKVNAELKEAFQGFEIYDYMLSEELNIKNAVPTAEGAVQLALEELPVTLNGLKVLIVGMGRIGTAIVRILQGFGADITGAVHNSRGAAKAKLHGIKAVPTKRLGGDYGLVFNTVPQLVLDHDKLAEFSNNTLFIDLASKPGGIDFEAALSLGLKVIWALGLPGKTAPVTAGEIIAETVISKLEERGEAIE
ncbi:dipicolinate synthase subunit DpsA [Ruminococcus sp.]|uniref:dipicolinate synthase subunit DpsA n=1 Tax=Ruminococcus sp. TaxID=41978 RepID=UPI0025D37012|nr:dipicolinate synthase subunit DpsA [Ruminococcus sp.]